VKVTDEGNISAQTVPPDTVSLAMALDHPNADKSEPAISWITNIDSEARLLDYKYRQRGTLDGSLPA
jgi:hypothetical protein